MDDEARAGNADEHPVDDLHLGGSQVAARHTEFEHLLRGEVDPAVRAERSVVREFHPGMLRREGVGESLDDRERGVASADAIDTGERIRCGARRAAARGSEDRDQEKATGEGQGSGGQGR